MAITAVPKVYLRIEPEFQHRAMFVNPNQGNPQPDALNGGVNTLRVYHQTTPTETPSLIEDVALPYVTGEGATQPNEVYFTPDRPGTFTFRWAFLDPDATPVPVEVEGPLSNAAVFVYGRLSILKTLLTTQACLESSFETEELLRTLVFASREFEQMAGWHFYPKYFKLRTQGEDTGDLRLPYPIIEVLEARRLDVINRSSGRVNIMSPDEYAVYNRHIQSRNAYSLAKPSRPDGAIEAPGDGTGGMIGGNEDDRRRPRISLLFPNEYLRGSQHTRSGDILAPSVRGYWGDSSQAYATGFRKGRQNIEVIGFFGYTEPDLSTPYGATFVTERMSLRQLIFEQGDPDQIDRILYSHKITMEKTDLHSIQYRQQDPLIGAWTGDNEIDRHIAGLSRNMGGGHV